MSAIALIREALSDGITFQAQGGKLKAKGKPETIARWTPRIVENKQEIISTLEDKDAVSIFWSIHYKIGSTVKIWIDSTATEAELLVSRPGAVAAQPVSTAAPPTTVTSCGACANSTYRGGCGQPAAAGLSDRDGVIRYHPAGGADCATWEAIIPPDLELLIQESAT